MDIRLESVDPDQNRFRAYRLSVEPDLFAPCALRVAWGRIGRPGRERIVASGEPEAVLAEALRLLSLRRRHGYAVVAGA